PLLRRPPPPPLFPYTTLFRSPAAAVRHDLRRVGRHMSCVAVQIEVQRIVATKDIRALVALPRPQEQVVPAVPRDHERRLGDRHTDRKSTRLNSSHVSISYAVF